MSGRTFELSGRRRQDARTPGPGWRKCTVYRQTKPGGLPLALRLSEGLGRIRHAATRFVHYEFIRLSAYLCALSRGCIRESKVLE